MKLASLSAHGALAEQREEEEWSPQVRWRKTWTKGSPSPRDRPRIPQANNPDERADQGSNPILIGAEGFQERATPKRVAEIRRLRREDSIITLEHPEAREKQSNHLAEGSVNIVKGLIRTLRSSTESNLKTTTVSPADTMDH